MAIIPPGQETLVIFSSVIALSFIIYSIIEVRRGKAKKDIILGLPVSEKFVRAEKKLAQLAKKEAEKAAPLTMEKAEKYVSHLSEEERKKLHDRVIITLLVAAAATIIYVTVYVR